MYALAGALNASPDWIRRYIEVGGVPRSVFIKPIDVNSIANSVSIEEVVSILRLLLS